MSKYRLHTRSLTLAETRWLLEDAIRLFGELGVDEVEIQFGWACSEAVQWTSRPAAIGEVVSILQKTIIEGDYELGEADVSLVAKDRGLEIRLCHESDVHAETEDPALIEAIEVRWLALGFKGHTSGGPEKAKARFWGPPGEMPDSRADRDSRIRNDRERRNAILRGEPSALDPL